MDPKSESKGPTIHSETATPKDAANNSKHRNQSGGGYGQVNVIDEQSVL